MSRAASIHIGVNRPQVRHTCQALGYSETNAWRMAGLAVQEGCGSVLVLRGQAATVQAVRDALAGAAAALSAGDTLFVSFSGHGVQQPDASRDDEGGWDEAWCLADDTLLDDELAVCWRRFAAGVRILVVADCCHGGGTGRDGEPPAPYAAGALAAPPPPMLRTPVRGVLREPVQLPAPVVTETGPCITTPPASDDGIQASVLLLSAAGKDQPAREGLFSRYLLDLCEQGFRGSYCDLYRVVRARVLHEASPQEPRILMLGAPDLDFPNERAFDLSGRMRTRSGVYR